MVSIYDSRELGNRRLTFLNSAIISEVLHVKLIEGDKVMSIREMIVRLERFQGRDQYVGHEKRKYVRLSYPPQKRPVLKVGNYKVEVVDISEGGMKLFNYMQHKLGPKLQGMVEFPSGISYEVKGEVVWQFKTEIGLLSNRIPRFIIEEEVEYLLRYFQEKEAKPY